MKSHAIRAPEVPIYARGAPPELRVRGRSWVALLLVGFVLVATGVIWRRSYGDAHAVEERRLEQQRGALEAERAKLEGDIRDASSRASLARVAQDKLKMNIPSDSQVIYLHRPTKPKATGAH